jgi:replication factor A2
MNVDSNGSGPAKLTENMYARVWGKLKAFSNKRHLGAHAIRQITDYNEISYHLLEATAVHLHFTRGPPGATKAGEQNGTSADTGMTNGGGGGGGGLPAGASATARKVYEVIRTSPQSNEGLNMYDIAQRLDLQADEVLKSGEQLLDMGVIYTTIDDHTWALMTA